VDTGREGLLASVHKAYNGPTVPDLVHLRHDDRRVASLSGMNGTGKSILVGVSAASVESDAGHLTLIDRLRVHRLERSARRAIRPDRDPNQAS